jgi:hypothetical protein
MTITKELAEILGDVHRPGNYFVAGRTEFLAPRLEVKGLAPSRCRCSRFRPSS